MPSASKSAVFNSILDTGVVRLDLPKSAIAKIGVSGTDFIFNLADGSVYILQGMAMRLMTQPALRLVFTDITVLAGNLIKSVGQVAFNEVSAKMAQSQAEEFALKDAPKSKSKSKSKSKAESKSGTDAISDSDASPANGPAAEAPQGPCQYLGNPTLAGGASLDDYALFNAGAMHLGLLGHA